MKVSEPSQESKWSGICFLVVPIVHLFDIWFWNCPDCVVFCVFILFLLTIVDYITVYFDVAH